MVLTKTYHRSKKLLSFFPLGISNPTVARSGNLLPGARTLSLTIYPDVPIEDPIWTLNAMQYGQIITHDMSMIAGSTQARMYIFSYLDVFYRYLHIFEFTET